MSRAKKRIYSRGMVREASFLRNAVRPDSVGGSAIFVKLKRPWHEYCGAPFSEPSCKFSKHSFFKTAAAGAVVGFGV